MTAPVAAGDLDSVDSYFDDGALEDALERSGVSDAMEGSRGAASPAEIAKLTGPIPGGGKLLEERSAGKILKAVERTLDRHNRLAKNRSEQSKHSKYVLHGVQFTYLEKNEDRSTYQCVVPPFVDPTTAHPVPNKVKDLKKKIISQLLVDDYLPNPKADGDTDKDRGAADLTKKFLRQDGTSAGTNDRQRLREVLSINIGEKSGFLFGWVDKTGGGWRPKQIKAHPQAQDASPEMRLLAPKIDPATNQPAVDPSTGEVVLERTDSPILRYVAEVETEEIDPKTGEPVVALQFTEDPAAAARQWLPKIRSTLIYPGQVRTVPMSTTAFDAQQIILIMGEPLGAARRRFEVLDMLSQEQLQGLCAWRPPKNRWKDAVPPALRPKASDGVGDEAQVTDDTFLFWYHCFWRISGDYVDGGEIAVTGGASNEASPGGFLLKRDTLREDVKADDGTLVPVLMDPPVAQFICLQDTDGGGDPFGHALIEDFSGGNESYAQIWMGLLATLDKNQNLNVYIPSTSPITRAEHNRRDGTPLEILTADDIPQHEQHVPETPVAIDMLDRIELTMNSEAGTNETSSGLDSKYSISGKAKEVAIRQARTALAQYWQNTVNGLTAWWRIKTQLAQAKFTVPMQVALSGIESAYKQPWWVGSDTLGISDVTLESGSGSMMSAMEKVPLLQAAQTNGWVDAETAGDMFRSSMTDDLGLPPNIHEERINRAIADWSKGPPQGWAEAQAKNAQLQEAWTQQVQGAARQLEAQGVVAEDAMAQAQQMVPPPQLTPLYTPFEPRPNDDDPTVAVIQYKRMNRMASTAEYKNHEAPWRALFDQKYLACRQAAGVVTVADQQRAQQEAANQQAAAAAQGEQGKVEDRERERQFKAEQADKDRDAGAETQARDSQTKEAIAAQRATPPAANG